MEGLWEPHAGAQDSLANEDQIVEGLLARAGRLPPGCIRLDVCCVAEGGRLSLSWSWSSSYAPQKSWEGRGVLIPSCSPQKSRPKCRAAGLERPVYIGLGIHGTPGLFGTANYHWLLSCRWIREVGTLPSAWMIWGRCPEGLTGSLVLKCWNWIGLLGADWPSVHHE